MERRKFISLISMALMAFAIFFATGQGVRAQDPNCCKYSVIAKGLPDFCYPVKLFTQWGSGLDIQGIPGNGQYFFAVPQPCPPAIFKWATLDPTFGPFVPLNGTGIFKIGNCCYEVTVKLDANKCIVIYILPCP